MDVPTATSEPPTSQDNSSFPDAPAIKGAPNGQQNNSDNRFQSAISAWRSMFPRPSCCEPDD